MDSATKMRVLKAVGDKARGWQKSALQKQLKPELTIAISKGVHPDEGSPDEEMMETPDEEKMENMSGAEEGLSEVQTPKVPGGMDVPSDETPDSIGDMDNGSGISEEMMQMLLKKMGKK